MEIVVLGSLEVVADPPVRVRGPQLRRLLAVLIADADRVVSTDRLLDVVFDGQPSDAAATTLRSYIARLRRLLTDDGTGIGIETVQPGYRLVLGTSTVDASMFEAEVAAARGNAAAGELATALERLDAALSRWRGTPYAEFADEEWVRPEVARLSELRLGATELRLDLLVEAGDHDVALGDVRTLAESNPLREPPWRIWVLALYRSGRQAEALRVAAGFRRQLGDLGLDPSPEFAALEHRVAAHDPEIRQPGPPRRRLRGYVLVDEVGRGRHGVVHRAIQPGIEREVALRTLGVEVADHPEFIRTFDALVRRLARLEHPHVVQILDFWREPAAAHLASRLLTGGTLTDVLDKGPAPADQVARIAEQASAGLHAAHQAGLSHGALAPPEILFDDRGNAYVDGIVVASALDQLLGPDPPPSPYQPPVGAEDGSTADQYALAAIVYQALTGFPPSGRSRGDHFPPVSEFRPELLAVDAVLARAGAPAPHDRYPDVVAFARALSSAVGRTHSPLARSSATPANPYKGLRSFEEADAVDFFGRRRSIADLLDLLDAGVDRGRFITVVGPSGSGKSSLVRAGLLPRLRAGAVTGSSEWFVATMLPGASPFASLRDALVTIASGPSAASLDPGADGIAASVRKALIPGGQLLLVIDQLEELFTLTSDTRTRSSFIHQLASVVNDPSSPLRIVATLRADCYDLPLADHLLGDLVSAGTVPIPAMSAAELEQAVVGPAARVGVIVEGDLATQLVTEVVNQPGSLPLLQFSMTELFDRRQGDTITLVDHERSGGLAGAIADRAEQVHGSLPPEEQAATRWVFLRLTAAGAGRADVRRRTTRSELLALPDLAPAAERLIDRFGRARLLTFDHDPETREQTVEVAHEALLRAWPRLRDWIRDEGRGLEIRTELTAAADAWSRGGEEAGDLYRGARLAVVETWAAEHPNDVIGAERDFLDASVAARAAEEQAQQQRLDRERGTNRRLRRVLALTAMTLAVAVLLGAVAFDQRNRARAGTLAAEQARAGALAATASSLVNDDRSLALLLAVEASRIHDTTATRRALLEALVGGTPPTRTVIPTPASAYAALTLAPDGRVAVAKRDDGALDVIDLESRTVRHAGLAAPSRIAEGVDIDPSGSLVASAGLASGGIAVVVYDLDTGRRVTDLAGPAGEIHGVRFTRDGASLAVSDSHGRIALHDLATGEVVRTFDLGVDQVVTTFVFTADGDTLAAVTAPFGPDDPDDAGRLHRVDVTTGRVDSVELDPTLAGASALVEPEGLVLVGDTRIATFDLDTLEPVGEPFAGTDVLYSALASSPDGSMIAAGGWVDLDLFTLSDSGVEPLPGPDTGAASGVAFLPGGGQLITADADGTISTWTLHWDTDLGTPFEPSGPGLITLSPDGGTLAAWGLGRGVRLYDSGTLRQREALDMDPEQSILGVTFHPDSRRIAVLTCPFESDPCTASLTLFDAVTGAPLRGPVPVGDVWAGLTEGVAFTGDARHLATAGPSVHLWDAEHLQTVAEPFALGDDARLPDTEVRQLRTALVDGRSLVVGGGELGGAAVWAITGDDIERLGDLGGNAAVGFTADGQLITATGPGSFQLRDPFDLQPLGGPFITDHQANWYHSNHDGLLVASGPWGAQLWDIPNREQLSGVLPSASAAPAPDGTTIYLGGFGFPGGLAGDHVRALDLSADHLRERACGQAGRDLTSSEGERYLPPSAPDRAICTTPARSGG